jgi:hypothetical protein
MHDRSNILYAGLDSMINLCAGHVCKEMTCENQNRKLGGGALRV